MKYFLALFIFLLANSAEASSCKKLNIYNSEKEIKSTFDIVIANNSFSRSRGLMFVKDMPLNKGMLFIWDDYGQHAMWMKNTYISLDMIFIKDNKIVGIITKTEPESLKILSIKSLTDKVLEINAGLVNKYDIKVGDLISCD